MMMMVELQWKRNLSHIEQDRLESWSNDQENLERRHLLLPLLRRLKEKFGDSQESENEKRYEEESESEESWKWITASRYHAEC